MANLLEQVKSYITPIFVENISHKLEEKPEAIVKVMHGVAATSLSALVQQSENPVVNQKIYELLRQAPSGNLQQLETLVGTGNLAHNDPREAGGRLFGLVFGDHTHAVLNSLSAFSGAKPGTTSVLSGTVGAIIVNVLGRTLQSEQLSLPGFYNLLHKEHAAILTLTPPETAALLGIIPENPADAEALQLSSDRQWLGGLLLALALTALLFLLTTMS